jgi:hypothetical protein
VRTPPANDPTPASAGMNEQSNRIIFDAMRSDNYYYLLLFLITAESSFPEHGRMMSGLKNKVNTDCN